MAASRSAARRLPRPALDPERVAGAFDRLARQRALQTLVRGALTPQFLRRLLKDATVPRRAAAEMPHEVWSSLAAAIALANPGFGVLLAQALSDHLAWDREPADMDGWWQLVVDRPLQALWMAALSENKTVRKEFVHVAEHCLENFRSSPACVPPSWEFVEGLLEVQAESLSDLREAAGRVEDAERKHQAERERLEELREELKRLRRETSDLRAEKAQTGRRAEALAAQAQKQAETVDARRLEELERRLRKVEKEREHLARELERRGTAAPPPDGHGLEAAVAPAPGEPSRAAETEGEEGDDPNQRRRVLRQMLRKLYKKGKIGASHTHEDNVYRGVADHEKGIAKEAMDLLYREGLLVPKPTTSDPHVSLSPDRTTEIRAIIAGEISNPRLQRFVE